jgi:Mg-chelatase subunit ChlD
MLAIDASGSTIQESSAWRRMLDAHHAALSHPAVVEAILRRRVRAMAAAWSIAPTHVLPWRDLRTPSDVARFADAVAALVPGGGSTSTGALLAAVPGWLSHAGDHRPVLDVATDGEDDFLGIDDLHEPGGNTHPRLIRDQVLAACPDLTINGLIVGPEDGPGHRFFVRHIQGGPGAFCLVVQDDLDVARCLRQKLIQELA